MTRSILEQMQTVDEIIAWDRPAPVRRLTREEIAAEYGEAAVRPGKPKPAPLAETYSRFVVHRVFDDGRKEVVSGHRTHEEAAAAADKARDNMSDAECGGDFTYLPGTRDPITVADKKANAGYAAHKERKRREPFIINVRKSE